MQREFIISWNRCEWITNQAFPKYVWLQNGAKVFRKSHFNFLCICSLSFEDTNLMNSLVPDFTLQRVQVLIDFQHIEQLQKWQFQCYFKIFLAQLWIECMNVHTYVVHRPTLDPSYTLLDTNRISLFYFVLFQTSAILYSIILHCHEVRFFLLMHTYYMAHKTLFSRVILEICKKVVHRA